eukprot:TRINITY_DN66793_c0_g1_i1.p1 TRINITY_DN66793_c0_g1~~TRINITY_DN66793_c0_g1_i1.p1  ORF type:complete len:233 (-),score=40.24 TRINITY_DN66793_c0_g1_i1:89-739(-)
MSHPLASRSCSVSAAVVAVLALLSSCCVGDESVVDVRGASERVVKTLEKTHLQTTLNQSRPLLCSACSWSAWSLRAELADKVKRKAAKSSKARRKAAEIALKEPCLEKHLPSQIAEMGKEDERRFEDFQKMLTKGGSLTNLNMKPEHAETIVEVCSTIVEGLRPAIIEKVASYKDRVGGFNWERWVCVKHLGVCKDTQLDLSKDDEEEEEDNESEL